MAPTRGSRAVLLLPRVAKVSSMAGNLFCAANQRPTSHAISGVGITRQTSPRRHASTGYLPIILQPSFWRSVIPKAFRSSEQEKVEVARPKSKSWNPATFFIVIFLLIGSQAVQMISLQTDFVQFSNQTEAKLALLRDVVRRVQAGEDVDVKAVLGTGDNVKEKEWEEVLKELEEEDILIQSRRQKASAKKAIRDAAAKEAAAKDP